MILNIAKHLINLEEQTEDAETNVQNVLLNEHKFDGLNMWSKGS